MLKLSDKQNQKNQISEYDVYSFTQSVHYHSHHFLGSRILTNSQKQQSTQFTCFAPNAQAVSLIGDFNQWSRTSHPMKQIAETGIWTCSIQSNLKSSFYQYALISNSHTELILDPFSRLLDSGSRVASKVVDDSFEAYSWNDNTWISNRETIELSDKPISILSIDLRDYYSAEVLTYQELAKEFVARAQEVNASHIEFKNLYENIFEFEKSSSLSESFYFAVAARFGQGCDLKCLIDFVHQNNIGVVLNLPILGINFSKKEQLNTLLSALIFWLEEFHVDGFNMGQIAALLSRTSYNVKSFLLQINQVLHSRSKGVFTFVEDESGCPDLTKPGFLGGLGFNMKSNIYFPNEINKFFKNTENKAHDFVCSSINLFAENFIIDMDKLDLDLDLLKLILPYYFTVPTKKLFSDNFIKRFEQNYFADLSKIYFDHKVFHQSDFRDVCMEWVKYGEEPGVYAYLRWSRDYSEQALMVMNLSESSYNSICFGVPETGFYQQIFDSNAEKYTKIKRDYLDGVYASLESRDFRPYSLCIDLEPRSFCIYYLRN
jgi:1,4-alpha-glucan branching enzyme